MFPVIADEIILSVILRLIKRLPNLSCPTIDTFLSGSFIFLNDTSGTWTAAIVRPEASQQLCWVDSGFTGEQMKKKDGISW